MAKSLKELIAAGEAFVGGGDKVSSMSLSDLIKSGEATAKDVGPEEKPVLGPLWRGIRQGATLGFGDEWGGAIQSNAAVLTKALGKLGLNRVGDVLGVETRYADEIDPREAYQQGRDAERSGDDAARAANSKAFFGGELVGGLVAPVPGGQAAKGAKFLKRAIEAAKGGAKLGAAYGLGKSDADLTTPDLGQYGRAALDTALGGATGFAGGALAETMAAPISAGAKWLGQKAAGKVAKIEQGVSEAGKEAAGSVTNSARGEAGRSATAAYKNPENIEKAINAGAMTLDDLAPDELAAYRALLRERGMKAKAEMIADAAKKTEKAEIFRQAMETEEQRAADWARQKLSADEFKSQVGARLKRYGLPMAGGAIGYATDDDPVWGAIKGAAFGGASGAVYRPMLQSLLRLGRQPVTQKALWRTVQGLAPVAGGAASAVAAPARRGLLFDEIQDSLAGALAGDEQDEWQKALADAVRRR